MPKLFRTMDNRIQLIAYQYKILNNGISEDSDKYLLIQVCLSLLSDSDRHFLYMEYIGQDEDWWLDYYSRASYYRHKKRIMEKFLMLYDQSL